MPGARVITYLSRYHQTIPILEHQKAENVAKILNCAPLGHLFYLKGPQEPLLRIEIHQNSRFYLKCFLNKAKNPGIFLDRAKINTHLRKIHNIHRFKEVGNPGLGARSPIGVLWREGIAY